MKRGFALIAVLTVAIIVGLGVVTILQIIISNTALQKMSVKAAEAQYFAEAGLQNALYDCRASGCAAIPANYTVSGQTVDITTTNLGNNTFRINANVTYTDS